MKLKDWIWMTWRTSWNCLRTQTPGATLCSMTKWALKSWVRLRRPFHFSVLHLSMSDVFLDNSRKSATTHGCSVLGGSFNFTARCMVSVLFTVRNLHCWGLSFLQIFLQSSIRQLTCTEILKCCFFCLFCFVCVCVGASEQNESVKNIYSLHVRTLFVRKCSTCCHSTIFWHVQRVSPRQEEKLDISNHVWCPVALMFQAHCCLTNPHVVWGVVSTTGWLWLPLDGLAFMGLVSTRG